jgi:hypothetical protein
MGATVADVMRHLNNYFETGYRKTDFSITGGVLSPGECLHPGSYIAVEGSCFHNGVWKLGTGLTLEGNTEPDETFNGKVWFLSPPKDFLALCKDVADFAEKTPVGAFQSETFEDYSYTRATGQNGAVLGWKEAFASSLSPYRKMFTEVHC